jgi:hypothetical protein
MLQILVLSLKYFHCNREAWAMQKVIQKDKVLEKKMNKCLNK